MNFSKKILILLKFTMVKLWLEYGTGSSTEFEYRAKQKQYRTFGTGTY